MKNIKTFEGFVNESKTVSLDTLKNKLKDAIDKEFSSNLCEILDNPEDENLFTIKFNSKELKCEVKYNENLYRVGGGYVLYFNGTSSGRDGWVFDEDPRGLEELAIHLKLNKLL